MAKNKQQQKIKGNPASTRMSNTRLKERRARSWERGEKRKIENAAANKARHQKNLSLKANGKLTPWEYATKKRQGFRHRNCKTGYPCKLNKEYQHV